MLPEDILYKIQTADFNSVFAHLVKCDADFVPRLSTNTDITAYSKKIVENSITFEAWIKDELAGLIAAYFNDEKKHLGFITNVSTAKEYSGKGVASQLMQMCISYAEEQKFGTIILEVFKHNNGAIKLYGKYGFYQTEIKGDSIIMQKNLK